MVTNNASLKEQDVRHPSDTVVLGEKLSDAGDYYMDLFENPWVGGNDASVVDQCRHDNHSASSLASGQSGAGGSNYAMTDGSARFYKFPQAVKPIHLWCISDIDRAANAGSESLGWESFRAMLADPWLWWTTFFKRNHVTLRGTGFKPGTTRPNLSRPGVTGWRVSWPRDWKNGFALPQQLDCLRLPPCRRWSSKVNRSFTRTILSVPFRELVIDAKKSLPAKGQKPALDDNLIIHGDNLHALKALLPVYAGKVDCIFIDPPYNTGNEGWCYNDNVRSPLMREWLKKSGNPVEKEDLERHDKWLVHDVAASETAA